MSRNTPATFLLHAQNDSVDDVGNSLVYCTALKDAGVPVELHLYAEGGHAFGLRRLTGSRMRHIDGAASPLPSA